MFRNDRKYKRGGAAVYISTDLAVKKFTDVELPEPLFLEIRISKRKRLLLVTFFRPSTQNKLDVDSYFSDVQSAITTVTSRKSF